MIRVTRVGPCAEWKAAVPDGAADLVGGHRPLALGWTGGEGQGVGLHEWSIVHPTPPPACAGYAPYSGRSGRRRPRRSFAVCLLERLAHGGVQLSGRKLGSCPRSCSGGRLGGSRLYLPEAVAARGGPVAGRAATLARSARRPAAQRLGRGQPGGITPRHHAGARRSSAKSRGSAGPAAGRSALPGNGHRLSSSKLRR